MTHGQSIPLPIPKLLFYFTPLFLPLFLFFIPVLSLFVVPLNLPPCVGESKGIQDLSLTILCAGWGDQWSSRKRSSPSHAATRVQTRFFLLHRR